MLLNRERANEVMDRHGLTALVATTPENVYYLTDYAREPPFLTGRDHNWAILPRDEGAPAVLMVNEFELPSIAQSPPWVSEIRVHTGIDTVLPERQGLPETEQRIHDLMTGGRASGSPDKQGMLVRTLKELGLDTGAIGFDELEIRDLTVPDISARGEDGTNVFREIRVVKTEPEIELLKKAARMVEHSLAIVSESIEAGITTRELIHIFRSSMELMGGFGSHMTYGGADTPWVGFPDLSYRLKDGDVLFIDPAGTYKHYWADAGRSAVVGNRPSAKFDELYGVLQACHRAVVPELRAGNSFSDLQAIARDAVASQLPQGFLPLFHSIGVEQYDHPQNRGDFGGGDLVLESGMTINFETLYFELGWSVLQLEDTYLVTDSAPEQLTGLPQARLSTPRSSNDAE